MSALVEEPYFSTCEVCGQERPLMVNAMPGVAMSVGRCHDCVGAGAYPLAMLVANTWCMNGMSGAALWWQEMVEESLAVLKVTREEFDRLVAELDEPTVNRP